LFEDDTTLNPSPIRVACDASKAHTIQGLHKVDLKPKGVNITVGEKELDEERMSYSRDGRKDPGFATSIVPTLEENEVAKQHTSQTADKLPGQNSETKCRATQNGIPRVNAAPSKARMQSGENETSGNEVSSLGRTEQGELYGVPADTSRSSETDDQPPHTRSGIDDTDTQEQAARARSIFRKHLGTKSTSKVWTLPATAPHVDPQGFEDPVSDAFWKKVWVACAAHNVLFLLIFNNTRY
jgi:phospholipase D1/2